MYVVGTDSMGNVAIGTGGGILGYSAGHSRNSEQSTGLIGLKVKAMDVTSGLWFAIVDVIGDMVSVYSAARDDLQH